MDVSCFGFVTCLQMTFDGAVAPPASTSTANYLSPPRSATQQLQAALAAAAHSTSTADAPPSPPFVLPATTPPPALCHFPHPLLHPIFSSQSSSTPVQAAPITSTASPPTMYLPVSSADSSYHFYVEAESGDHQNRERRARISLSHLSQSVRKIDSVIRL